MTHGLLVLLATTEPGVVVAGGGASAKIYKGYPLKDSIVKSLVQLYSTSAMVCLSGFLYLSLRPYTFSSSQVVFNTAIESEIMMPLLLSSERSSIFNSKSDVASLLHVCHMSVQQNLAPPQQSNSMLCYFHHQQSHSRIAQILVPLSSTTTTTSSITHAGTSNNVGAHQALASSAVTHNSSSSVPCHQEESRPKNIQLLFFGLLIPQETTKNTLLSSFILLLDLVHPASKEEAVVFGVLKNKP
jgi:hypothetical protein